ncbi:hypothetical protein ACVRZ4_06455 [Streptococcus pasteurianus]
MSQDKQLQLKQMRIEASRNLKAILVLAYQIQPHKAYWYFDDLIYYYADVKMHQTVIYQDKKVN